MKCLDRFGNIFDPCHMAHVTCDTSGIKRIVPEKLFASDFQYQNPRWRLGDDLLKTPIQGFSFQVHPRNQVYELNFRFQSVEHLDDEHRPLDGPILLPCSFDGLK